MATELLTTPCLAPMSGRRAAATIALMLVAWLTAFFAPELLAQARGPILRVTPDPYGFDTTQCGTTKCGTITFRNVGDTTLRVYSIEAPVAPFSGAFATPFQLDPGDSRQFEVCYTPASPAARDSHVVRFRADTRVSLSIGMLFDVSGSMADRIGPADATTRIAAAHNAGRSFIDNILTTADIQDEAAVFQFGASADFAVRQTWTSDRNLLRAAVPNTAPGTFTCLYRSIAQTVQHVATRANRRVLIVLTDGADACDAPGSTLLTAIGAAQSAGIRVFTIGIGGANAAILQQIASATGGQYFTATSASDLVGVYRTIATLLGQNIEGSFGLHGRAVSPFMVLEPTTVSFDSTRVGASVCRPLVIRNTGTAPLVVSGVDGIATPFAITGLPIAPIMPGATATVEVCFAPDRLRVLAGTALFQHNACSQDAVELPLTGIGYDSLTLWLGGTFTARPGSIIEIPVRLAERLPANYDVRSMSFTVAYDKTVLYPADDFIMRDETESATMTSATHNTAYGATEASTRVDLDGGLVDVDTTNGVVARLAFMVLHGSSLTTDVRITEALFADGNPRAGFTDSALVVADSLCYQADRLIDASARYGGVFRKVVARGDGSGATATFAISSPAATRLTLHDALGREVMRLVDEWLDAGVHVAELDLQGLVNGTYYLRVETMRDSDVRPITVMK